MFAIAAGVLGTATMVPLMASSQALASGCPDGTYLSWAASYDPPTDAITIPDLAVTFVWVDTELGRFQFGDGTPMNNQTVNVTTQVGAPAEQAGFCKGQPTTTTAPPTTAPPTTAPPTTAPPTTAPPTTAPPTTAPPTTAPPTTAPPTTAPPTTATTEPPATTSTTSTTSTTIVAVNPPTQPPVSGATPPPVASPPVTQLPATGTAAWVTAALAACALGAGLFLLRIARRPA